MSVRPQRAPRSDAPGREGHALDLAGEGGVARPSGALWLPGRRALIVADLHLGKSDRLARIGGPLLPPYEGLETLSRLGAEIEALGPRLVVSLGDAFDDPGAARAPEGDLVEGLLRLMAGRRWVWMAGNHDPSPPAFGGEARATLRFGSLHLGHEPSLASPPDGCVEISGHLHPKARIAARGRRISRRCFLFGASRLILPAFGAYTGGLDMRDAAFDRLLGPGAEALLCSGGRIVRLPRDAR